MWSLIGLLVYAKTCGRYYTFKALLNPLRSLVLCVLHWQLHSAPVCCCWVSPSLAWPQISPGFFLCDCVNWNSFLSGVYQGFTPRSGSSEVLSVTSSLDCWPTSWRSFFTRLVSLSGCHVTTLFLHQMNPMVVFFAKPETFDISLSDICMFYNLLLLYRHLIAHTVFSLPVTN